MRLMLKSLLNDIYGITIDKQKPRKSCIFLQRVKRRKRQPLILGPEIKKKKTKMGGGICQELTHPNI